MSKYFIIFFLLSSIVAEGVVDGVGEVLNLGGAEAGEGDAAVHGVEVQVHI